MPSFQWIWIVAMVEAGVVAALFAGVVALQLTKNLRLRRRNQFHAAWRPLLVQSLSDIPQSVPAVRSRDTLNFLFYWNYFHESLLGEDKLVGLNQLARLAGMDRAALKLLKANGLRKRLMAIITVGHLGEQSAWNDLVALAQSPHPIVSLSAARALVDINPKAALPLITPWIGARADWSPPKVAAILAQIGSALIAQPLSEAALVVAPDMAMRILHYLEVTRCTAGLPAVRTLLARESAETALKVACLKLIGQFQDPKDLALVRSFISHSDESVRAQAAVALGTIGMPADEGLLISLLADSQWDVRYRAAEALAHLPLMQHERLAEIHARQHDTAAKQILEPFLITAKSAPSK
ncbi:MAG: HEAT repeat domain-containing protein [Nitrospirales bacterium]